jgi:hypothetical protein
MSEPDLKAAMIGVARAVAELNKEDPKIMDQLFKQEDFQQVNEAAAPIVGGVIYGIKKIKARTEQYYKTPLVQASPKRAAKVKRLHDRMVDLENALDVMIAGIRESITGTSPEDQAPFIPILNRSWRDAVILMFLDPVFSALVAKINIVVTGLIALTHGISKVVRFFGGLKPAEIEMLNLSEYEKKEMSAKIDKIMKDRLKDKYNMQEQMQRMQILAGIKKKVL